jgi:hypothetical protein
MGLEHLKTFPLVIMDVMYNIHTQGKTTPYASGENDIQARGETTTTGLQKENNMQTHRPLQYKNPKRGISSCIGWTSGRRPW